MKNYKKYSTLNLIAGYILSMLFILLIALNIKAEPEIESIAKINELKENNNTEIKYVDRFIDKSPDIFYRDHLDGAIIGGETTHGTIVKEPDIVYSSVDPVVIHENELQIHNRDGNRIVNRDTAVDGIGITETHVDGHRGFADNGIHGSRINGGRDDVITFEDATRDDLVIDKGLLDRRLREIKDDEIGLDTKDGLDLGSLSPVNGRNNSELGEVNNFDISPDGGYGVGKGGQLYAYNFPTKGLGAGVGSPALGAGGGLGAGISAGIGEAVLDGQSVPALGGIGDGSLPMEGYPKDSAPSAGVGGLLGGAGAGGAAGLTQGYITEKLGIGPGNGVGGGGTGIGEKGYNYEHLPKDGALHIMMHVDGSGSILNARKQLDIMKETILKDALLPYYNNDENLYNNRVTIVSSSGERTLKFFTEAAKKDNVLAIAFQDEAQPAYHLPNFNKKPEDHYVEDIAKLKSSLNRHNGVYRGVMFQVDRGKTFAKSFKEFVGNAFQGKGYLSTNNLKKYYRDNNFNHIKNKDGIVFSDEYHTKDSGDPQYYLNLIFEASKKIGLDLDIYGGGLKDGKYNNK